MDKTKKQAVKWLSDDKWGPELMSVIGDKTGKCPISAELIYQWKWDSKKDNTSEDNPYKTIYNHLKHGRRRRKRGSRKDSRGIIHNRVSIEKRPKVVKQQERVGDMESYFMVGKNHKGALLIIIDRASLYNRLNKLKTRNSKKVSKTMIKRLEKKARTHYIQ